MIWLHARPAVVELAPHPVPTAAAAPDLPPPGGTVTSGDIAELRGRVGQLETEWNQAEPPQRLDTLERRVAQLPRDDGAGTTLLIALFGLWLLLAIALGAVAWLLFRRLDELEPATAAAPSPPAPDATVVRLERRLAELEAQRTAPAPPPPPLVPAPTPEPVAAPPSLDDVAEDLRQLVNARGELESFNDAVAAQPVALAIVHGELAPFDPAAAMDQELVLFGSDDRLAVLPAPLRARDLQRTPNVAAALPESFAHLFAIEPGEGFRVVAPAFVRHDGGQVRLLTRGSITAG